MSEESAEYRIDFQIMRRRADEDDFTEYAFGSTSAERDIRSAGEMAHAAIQNDEYGVTA